MRNSRINNQAPNSHRTLGASGEGEALNTPTPERINNFVKESAKERTARIKTLWGLRRGTELLGWEKEADPDLTCGIRA